MERRRPHTSDCCGAGGRGQRQRRGEENGGKEEFPKAGAALSVVDACSRSVHAS